MRKILAALAVLTTVGGVGLVSTGTVQAQTAPVAGRSTITPKQGHYRGADADGRVVHFAVHNGQLTNLHVDGQLALATALVHAARFHETCHAHTCASGHWTAPAHVTGHWRDRATGHGATFTALWIGSQP